MMRQSLVRAASVGLGMLAMVDPAIAERRVYAGTEAQALKCAAYFGTHSYLLEQAGLISTSTSDKGMAAAAYILTHHVSGTPKQKENALKITLKRIPGLASGPEPVDLDVIEKHLEWCQAKFLR